jgi:hypothetical protein
LSTGIPQSDTYAMMITKRVLIAANEHDSLAQ